MSFSADLKKTKLTPLALGRHFLHRLTALILVNFIFGCASEFQPNYFPGLVFPTSTPTSVPDCVAGATLFGGGSGTAGDPYKICERAHLAAITGAYLTSYFIQKSNFDLGGSTTPWTPIGTYGGVGFTGNYDGNSKTITGLYYNTAGVSGVGLFAFINTGGVVKNLTLSAVSITTTSIATGALAGLVTGGTIQNCHSSGTIAGYQYTGGLIGRIDTSSAITTSSSSVNVSVSGAAPTITGGLVGYSFSSSTIQNSFATGSVAGGSNIGGLVGRFQSSATVTNSYSTGAVSGTGTFGGLSGVACGMCTATNSYWNTVTSGQAASANGTGLTTAQMIDYTNFTGWDFATIWNGAGYSGSSSTYPFFR